MAMILSIAALALSVCGFVHTIPAPLLDKFTFDDIFDSSFRVRGFSPNWLSGTNDFLYRERESGAVLRYHAPTDETTVYLDNSTFTELSTGTYFVSPDLQYVLFATDIYSQWRHSFYAQYTILNVDTKELTSFPSGDLAGSTLQYAGWSSTGNSLSFVLENNLYYQASPSSDYVKLTTDGDPTNIFNGVPDWLYEEDVISNRVSHYWSPDGKYICYARLDDNGVPLQAWPWYGSKSNVFGDTIEIAYPKAGDVRSGAAGPNTKVQMYVVDVTIGSSSTKRAPPPTELATVDHYYLQVAWRDSNNVYITWANRVQNKSISAIYDVTQPTLTPVENLNYEVSGGWVEVPPPEPWFIDDGASYLTVHPHTENVERGPWRHLALVTSPLTGPGAVTFLTTGEQEIDYVVGYDENLKLVYYISTMGDPAERHIVRIGTPDSDPQYQTPTCLTCNYPDECRYITSSFSSTGLYYFVNCRGPEIPTYTLKSLVPGEESKNVVMENNDDLRANLARIAMPTRQFFTFNIIGTEFTARGEIFLPPDYVPGEQLPLLVYAYAGPGSQRVMKTFPMGGSTSNWLLHLKSYYRVIVASIDGRGSMANGDKLKFQMYRNLGTVEVEDQILGGIELNSRPEVDSSRRSAIFGWSYGGGTAAHIMGNESQAFTCGISVAPVTTKMYYDTAYTERYLGLATPDDDEAGYNKTDVMNKVANFQNKKFLLAHGIADDNVHFMHTTQLIRALENADILFRQHVYPDQNHGISSPGQSRHLYHSMTDFLLNDCWDGTLQVGNPSSSPRTEQNLSITFGLLIIIFITGQL